MSSGGGLPVTFIWPQMLWMLVAVPVVVAVYVMLLRRKRKAALRYASLAFIRDAQGAGPRMRRHVPPLLFLAIFASPVLNVLYHHSYSRGTWPLILLALAQIVNDLASLGTIGKSLQTTPRCLTRPDGCGSALVRLRPLPLPRSTRRVLALV